MLACCLLTTLTPGLNPTLAPSRVPDAPDCWPLVRQVAMEVHREHLDEALQVRGPPRPLPAVPARPYRCAGAWPELLSAHMHALPGVPGGTRVACLLLP